MTHLTRRSFTHAGLGLLAGSAVSTTVVAQTYASNTSIASLYQTQFGRYKLTALVDGLAPLTRQHFFGEDEARIDETLSDFGVPASDMSVPLNVYLLQSSTETILIDAGMGMFDLLGPGFGHLTTALKMLGVRPSDVTKLVVTHAHPDHVGGLVSNGQAVFANAELAIAEKEHAYWMDPASHARAPVGAQSLFRMAQSALSPYSNRLLLVQNHEEVAPGLTLELSPGHTPGHSILHLDGGDQELLFIADTVHSAELHTALPLTGFSFDSDPDEAAQARLRVFDRAAADKTLLAGAHIHFPGLGRIVNTRNAYRYLPASWI
ncbi:MBL fold metallo-hydrolase [Roseobacteraceae bacterium S113]